MGVEGTGGLLFFALLLTMIGGGLGLKGMTDLYVGVGGAFGVCVVSFSGS